MAFQIYQQLVGLIAKRLSQGRQQYFINSGPGDLWQLPQEHMGLVYS